MPGRKLEVEDGGEGARERWKEGAPGEEKEKAGDIDDEEGKSIVGERQQRCHLHQLLCTSDGAQNYRIATGDRQCTACGSNDEVATSDERQQRGWRHSNAEQQW